MSNAQMKILKVFEEAKKASNASNSYDSPFCDTMEDEGDLSAGVLKGEMKKAITDLNGTLVLDEQYRRFISLGFIITLEGEYFLVKDTDLYLIKQENDGLSQLIEYMCDKSNYEPIGVLKKLD